MKQKTIISCLLLVCFFACQTNANKQEEIQPTLPDRIQLINEQIKIYTQENLHRQVENQNVYFGQDSLCIIPIRELISAQKFFFYFSSEACPPCTWQIVDYIKEVFPKYEEDKEIFFVSPDWSARLRENCHGKRLLTLQKDQLGIPLEDVYVPFIFTLDEDLRINTLHIVNKSDFSKTLEFLQMIKEIKQ